MSLTLNEALAALHPVVDHTRSVRTTLIIHSQTKSNPPNEVYGHSIRYGYGTMEYFAENPPKPKLLREYLASTSGSFKVLNNLNYAPASQGSWNEYQTFIVGNNIPERWSIVVDPGPGFQVQPPLQKPAPSLSLTMLDRPQVPAWTITLAEDNGFLRGVGPDPLSQNDKALYSIAFESIVDFGSGSVN